MALRFLDKQKRGLFLDRARLIPATIADLIPAAGGEISLVLAAYSESGPSTLTSPVINIASSDRPLAGTISLTYNSVSLGAFDTTAISAAGLAAYLNSSSGIKTDGGVDVWETDGNTYTIQMRSVGAVDTLALEYADFIPFGNAVIESIQTGDADERQAWTLRIEYGVISRQDTWTQSSTVSATITEVVTGSASVCEVQKIALSGTLVSGWWNISTASGLTSQLRWDASAAAVEGAINAKLGAGTVKVTQTADQTYLIAWVAVGAVSALTVTTTALTAIQTSTATLDLDTAEAASLPNGSRVQVQIMEGTEVLHQEQFYLSRLNNAGTYSEVGRAQFVRYDAAQTLTSDQQTQARSNISAAKSGAVTGSSLTMATARLLGRTTASTGAIEEISIGSGLTLSAGVLSCSLDLSGYLPLAGGTMTGTLTIGGSAPDFYGLALVPGTGTMTVSRATLGNTEYAQVSPTLIRIAGSVDSAGLDLYRGGLEIVNTSGFGAIIGSSTITADRTFAFPNWDGTFLTEASNTVIHGGADSASPSAQYNKVANVAAGTSNTAGVPRYYDACQGTGTEAGGRHIFRVAASGSSGSSQNALFNAFVIYSDADPNGLGTAGCGTLYANTRLMTSGADTVAVQSNTSSCLFRICYAGYQAAQAAVSFGGTSSTGKIALGDFTSSFPMISRSGTTVRSRLADDSDFCALQGKITTHANAATETITPDKTLTLYDAAGTAYKVPCVAA